jgi:hypothetical protein
VAGRLHDDAIFEGQLAGERAIAGAVAFASANSKLSVDVGTSMNPVGKRRVADIAEATLEKLSGGRVTADAARVDPQAAAAQILTILRQSSPTSQPTITSQPSTAVP